MRVCFDDWRIDGPRRELWIGSRSVAVEPLVFDLILFLAVHANRVVSKEELLEEVWGGTSVSHWAIARAVKEARRVFRENELDPERLRTVRGRGYLLNGPARKPLVDEELPARASAGAGREGLLADLEAAAAGRAARAGRLVMILGEPGIGKSWLVTQLLDRLPAGTVVGVQGRVPELGPRRHFAPWVQVLRSLFQQGCVQPDTLSEVARRVLLEHFPELRDWIAARAVGPTRDPTRDDSVQACFRLGGHLRALFEAAAGSGRLVIVLEDLHRADLASLDLLATLADDLRELRLLIVATARNSEWQVRIDQHARLVRLGEHPEARVIELGPLGAEEIRRLARDVLGRELGHAELQDWLDRTAGNPFLLLELARVSGPFEPAGDPSGSAGSLPSLSREVMTRRFLTVSPACRAFLTTAAVAGRDFHAALVGDALDTPMDRVHAWLDEARGARLLEATDGSDVRFRFVHALVAECLIAEAPTGAIGRAHAGLADALIRRGGGDGEPVAVAHHLLRSPSASRATEAVTHLRRAARRLRERQSFADSAALLRTALEIMAPREPVSFAAAQAIEARIELGETLVQAGEVAQGRVELRSAGERARFVGQVDLLVRSALSFAGVEESPGIDPVRVRFLEEATDALGDRRDALAVRVWGRLAQALQGDEHCARRERLAAAAVRRAREIGAPELVCDSLRAAHFACWSPDNLPWREASAREQLDLAYALGDSHRVHDAQMDLVADLVESGDPVGVDGVLADHEKLLGADAELVYAWHHAHYRVMRALADGDPARAERELDRASRLGERTGYELAGQWTAMQLFTLRRLQGRLAELAPLMADVSQQTPLVGWRLAAALAAAYAGEPGPAREAISQLVVDGELRIPQDFTWLVTAALCAELADRVGSPREQRAVRAVLAPYAARHAALYGMIDWGPVSRLLAPAA